MFIYINALCYTVFIIIMCYYTPVLCSCVFTMGANGSKIRAIITAFASEFCDPDFFTSLS